MREGYRLEERVADDYYYTPFGGSFKPMLALSAG